jgi:hypothetical protein
MLEAEYQIARARRRSAIAALLRIGLHKDVVDRIIECVGGWYPLTPNSERLCLRGPSPLDWVLACDGSLVIQQQDDAMIAFSNGSDDDPLRLRLMIAGVCLLDAGVRYTATSREPGYVWVLGTRCDDDGGKRMMVRCMRVNQWLLRITLSTVSAHTLDVLHDLCVNLPMSGEVWVKHADVIITLRTQAAAGATVKDQHPR